MGNQIKKNDRSGILVLLVFALFMVSVLMVLLTGADVVQRLTDRDQSSFDRRTAAQYVSTRVRQGDSRGAVSVASLAGQDVLVLSEDINGTVFETMVYCYDGYLREMFVEAGGAQDLEFGEKILPMEGFSAQLQDNTLQVRLQFADSTQTQLLLSLRSESEGTA